MASRRSTWTGIHLLVLVGAIASLGASHRTQNFVVQATTPEIARQVGQYAEHYRREKAREWLGREMPPWPEPCPLRVTVTMSGSGGATSFGFGNGEVLGQQMRIEGSLERLLASVLPHEVTHTVFAHHFRQPVPRWADEGGSVLSEDEVERQRHDRLVRQILNTRGRAMPLRRLFALREYPNDVMALYAQGYSVTNFLVSRSSRPAFLNFVADGMRRGWDVASQAHYGHASVEALEQAWLQHLRDSKGQPSTEVARGPATGSGPSSRNVVVRLTAPPAHPFMETSQPTIRGQSADPDLDERYRNRQRFQPTAMGRQPIPFAPHPGDCPNGVCPHPGGPQGPAPGYPPPAVLLGAPQPIPPATPHLGQPVFNPGYPH